MRFADLREESLLGYGYHTALAYWGDLEGLHDWAAERRKDVLNLTQRDFTPYVSRLLGEPGLGEPVGGVGLEVQRALGRPGARWRRYRRSFPRTARRTRRAAFTAAGSPRG